jgi:hypothetical protein
MYKTWPGVNWTGRVRSTNVPPGHAPPFLRLLLPLLVVVLVVPAIAGAQPSAPPTPSVAVPHAGSTLSASSLPFLFQSSMADDPHDGYVLTFGGADANGDATDWTYSFRDGTWTNLSSPLTATPPARWGAAMAYDVADQEDVLFGGCQGAHCNPVLGDTWVYANGSWSDVTSTAGTAPSPRGWVAMAWDSTDNELILFGGYDGGIHGGTSYNDTWGFVHGHWTNLTAGLSGGGPSRRTQFAFASVPSGGLVLFGGANANFADTWTFSNDTWRNISATAGSPPPRFNAMAAQDPAAGYVVMFGGESFAGAYLSDVWSFRDGTWSSLSLANEPAGLCAAAMAYDSLDQEVVMFGGVYSSGVTNAALTLHDGTWTLENPAAPGPSPALELLPFLAFPILLVVILAVALTIPQRRRRKADAQLKDQFPTPPGSEITWIPTASPGQMSRPAVVSSAVFLVVLLPVCLLLVVAAPPGSVGLDLVFLAGPLLIFILMPVLMVSRMLNTVTRTVGVCSAGVIVQRRSGEIRLPWSYLEAPRFVRTGKVVPFTFYYPDGTQRGAFLTDLAQARAITSNPAAAAWTIPEPIRRAIGLDSPTLPASSSATSPSTVRTASGSPATPRTTAAPPLATAPLPSTSPLPSPPSPRPSSSGYSTGSRPQLVRCPACGALAAVSAVRCSKCGQQLR